MDGPPALAGNRWERGSSMSERQGRGLPRERHRPTLASRGPRCTPPPCAETPTQRGLRHQDSASNPRRATPSRACTCSHPAQAREEGHTASCPNNSMQSSWISFAFFTILLEYSLCAFRSVTSNFPHLIRFSISADATIGLEQRSAGASREGACEGLLEEDGNRAPIREPAGTKPNTHVENCSLPTCFS